MKCKREGCDRPVTGKALYCSGACRTKASRASVSRTDTALPTVTVPRIEYVTVDGECYKRPAVICHEFGTRPEPLSLIDLPVLHNRGRCRRPDNSEYQFDARGHSFECKHPYKDKYGKPHLAVYETVADVRQAAGACL